MSVLTRIFSISILFTINFLLVISCNHGKKSANQELSDSFEDHLVVALKIKLLEDDNLELFYRKEEEQFSSDKRIQIETKGSQDFQTVLFVLDQHVFPSYIRLDLGVNENQGAIILGQFSFKYNDAEYTFTNADIEKYFRPNKGLLFDFDTMTGRGVRINDKYDPYLVSYNISYFVNKLILF